MRALREQKAQSIAVLAEPEAQAEAAAQVLEGDIVPNASRGESAMFRMVVQKAAVVQMVASV